MATIAEVAKDTFRINLEIPGAPIDVSFFVIRDEQPTLVETGFRRAFPDTYQAVARVIDPATLRYVVVPHLEGDESGALNLFLERAPAAVPVASPSGSPPTWLISPSASPCRSTATAPWIWASTG